MKSKNKVLFLSIIIVIGAQLNMNLFITNFKISLGIILLPLFLILYEEYPILPVTLLSAAGVYLSRILTYWFQHADIGNTLESYFPEMIFYLVYGILFFLYCRRHDNKLSQRSFLFLLLFDYLANLTELLLRLGSQAFNPKTQASIILVAIFRTLLIWCIFQVLRYYKFSLLKLEHAQRYQRLLLLISRLNGEVIWMRKNTSLIEDTMNRSYKLFQQMQDYDLDPSLSKAALEVAKDIHEIKKEYSVILRGLSDALDLNLKDEGMRLSDILAVLRDSLNTSFTALGKKIELDIQMEENLYTDNHYFMMSILRNLFTNAVEASVSDVIHIQFVEQSVDDDYLLEITDDGPGISEDNMEQIFSPGFSTKINYDTGEVNRGLGLNLVQDLIETQWKGEIGVDSVPGRTTFSIYIPKTQWKGEQNETISD